MELLNRLKQATPMKIVMLLTYNSSQFTDRIRSKKRQASGLHEFNVRCKALGIVCPTRHPQSNGMVERFNGTISKALHQTRVASSAHFKGTHMNYANTSNDQIPSGRSIRSRCSALEILARLTILFVEFTTSFISSIINMCRIPDDHKDAYETGLAENRTSPS